MIVCHGRWMEDEAMDEERQDQRMLDKNDISGYGAVVTSAK